LNASVRANRAGDAGGRWILRAGADVRVDFSADNPSDEVTLKVCALVSKMGPVSGYAPLESVL
jgi:hypothetical protein